MSPVLTSTPDSPAAVGYRWPAEWAPHAATWVSWPHNPNTWPGKFEPVPAQFAQMVLAIAEVEPVHVLAGGAAREMAEKLVGGREKVILHDIVTNDAWARDHGPTFLSGPDALPPALVDWEYNAWGGKYPPFDRDNAVPRLVAEITGRRRFATGVVLEGGAIEGDGEGTVLTTASCLLNANRNPGMTRERMQRYLADYLGARKVLWLPRGELAGDDTDGHIDQLARFVAPGVVVAAATEDAGDENYFPLKENLEALRGMQEASGRTLDVVELPLPAPKFYDDQRLPACYCNFYIANGLVLVPQFGDPADERAVEILRGVMPRHEVRGLPALDLVWGLGAFHCLTQQQPA
jgi:agmatine deiminase